MAESLADRLGQTDARLRALRAEALGALWRGRVDCQCDTCKKVRRAMERGTTATLTMSDLREGLRHNVAEGE